MNWFLAYCPTAAAHLYLWRATAGIICCLEMNNKTAMEPFFLTPLGHASLMPLINCNWIELMDARAITKSSICPIECKLGKWRYIINLLMANHHSGSIMMVPRLVSQKQEKMWMSISTDKEKDYMSLRVTDWLIATQGESALELAPGVVLCLWCTVCKCKVWTSKDVCGGAHPHSLSWSHPPRRFIWWPSEPSIVVLCQAERRTTCKQAEMCKSSIGSSGGGGGSGSDQSAVIARRHPQCWRVLI